MVNDYYYDDDVAAAAESTQPRQHVVVVSIADNGSRAAQCPALHHQREGV